MDRRLVLAGALVLADALADVRFADARGLFFDPLSPVDEAAERPLVDAAVRFFAAPLAPAFAALRNPVFAAVRDELAAPFRAAFLVPVREVPFAPAREALLVALVAVRVALRAPVREAPVGEDVLVLARDPVLAPARETLLVAVRDEPVLLLARGPPVRTEPLLALFAATRRLEAPDRVVLLTALAARRGAPAFFPATFAAPRRAADRPRATNLKKRLVWPSPISS